jgi:hypothetical protein
VKYNAASCRIVELGAGGIAEFISSFKFKLAQIGSALK